jgi:hypothetical protein
MPAAAGPTRRPRRLSRPLLRRLAVLGVTVLALLGLGTGLAAPSSAAPKAVLKIADEQIPVPSGFTTASWDCACAEAVQLIQYDYAPGSTTPVQRVVHSNGPSVSAGVALSGFELRHVYRFSLVSQAGTTRYADAGPVVTVEGNRTHPVDDLLGNPKVDRHGTSATIRTSSRRVALQFVSVGTQPPVATTAGLQLPPGSVVASAFSGFVVTDFTAELKGLTPSTHYFFVVRAVDTQTGGLGEQSKSGEFDTLERVVDTTFQKIFIDDDSDDLSDGEIQFAYYVDKWWFRTEPEHDLGTGDTMNVPYTDRWAQRRGDNSPVIARVMGHDDDGVTAICLWAVPSSITPSLGEEVGSDSCGDDASAAVALPVLPSDDTKPEAFTSTATIRTTKGSLKFTAQLSYRVFYW